MSQVIESMQVKVNNVGQKHDSIAAETAGFDVQCSLR